jgi:hypothetical protein
MDSLLTIFFFRTARMRRILEQSFIIHGLLYGRIGKFCATKSTTLWHTSYSKKRKENSTTFSMLFDEMQENLANTWRIPP